MYDFFVFTKHRFFDLCFNTVQCNLCVTLVFSKPNNIAVCYWQTEEHWERKLDKNKKICLRVNHLMFLLDTHMWLEVAS